MDQAGSEGVFELHGACMHSLRFSFGAPLDNPYAQVRVSEAHRPPALFRRMLAVSPPPDRKGAPWQTGMILDGEPFDPTGSRDRLADVRHQDGVANLDTPPPETVVLDWWFDVPSHQHTVTLPGDAGRYLTSVPCWDPGPESGRTVTYFATHRVDWATKPESGWVAVSFDAFWPDERDSADLVIPLGSCDEHCPN